MERQKIIFFNYPLAFFILFPAIIARFAVFFSSALPTLEKRGKTGSTLDT
jgi:hypothetical protein